jgi:peptidoglycan/xylan/chitin deacetylase (PgdA/CDA1 family)
VPAVKSWLRDLAKEALQSALLRGAFVWRLPASAGGQVGLTFDDGPHPEFTPALLDLLARHGAKASFFLVGARVDEHPEIARRIVGEGHAVGTHTYDHVEITRLRGAALAEEVGRGRQALRQHTGVDSALFRPPRGRVDWSRLRAVARLGYVVVHWSKTYSDYRTDGPGPLRARMEAAPMSARDIVLLHDHNPHTLAALETAIPAAQARGLAFAGLAPR